MATTALTGEELRRLREQLGMTQKQLAPMVGLTRSSLNHREERNSPLPATVTAAVLAIVSAKKAGAISNLPQKTKSNWRESKVFTTRPPFVGLPEKGTACGCGSARCGLRPQKDGDWPGRGHLWVFAGWVCNKRVYLDASGQKVQRPARGGEIVEFCSRCGRRRELGPRDSERLGEKVWHLRCRPQPSDPRDLQHDPPSYWWKRNGRLERLSEAALDQLHERHKRSFATPKCELQGCHRYGSKMPISCTARLEVKGGGTCQIAVFRCRASKGRKAHAAYRVLPLGEVAARHGQGQYRWVDSVTGSTIETERLKRPIHKDRIMPPDSACPQCHTQLVAVEDGRRVFQMVHGKRRWKKPLRCWKARCTSCSKLFSVRNDGQIKLVRNRWASSSATRGRKKDPDTALKISLAATFKLNGKSQRSMSRDLYPERKSSPDAAYTSTRKFFSKHRQAIEAECDRLRVLSVT